MQNLDRTIAVTHNYIDLTNLDEVLPDSLDLLGGRDALSEIELASLVNKGLGLLEEKGLSQHKDKVLSRLRPLVDSLSGRLDGLSKDLDSLRKKI